MSYTQVTAEQIARALNGKPSAGGWVCRCPAHDDSSPSLSVRDADGRVLLHCFAGCSRNEVINALGRLGIWLGGRGGGGRRPGGRVMPACGPTSSKPPFVPVPSGPAGGAGTKDARPPEEGLLRPHFAALPDGPARPTTPSDAQGIWFREVWRQCRDAQGTLVETYLRSRGITVGVSPALLFHPSLRHTEDGRRWPAMVAEIVDKDGALRGIHRTYLARDGHGKAPVSPQKMMLGEFGGNSVQLALADHTLLIGEGIETCLSAMQLLDLPAWAALSAGNMDRLELPPIVREVIALADADVVGRAAAQRAAVRWKRLGLQVRIVRPREAGQDMNDLLLGAIA